MRTKFKILDSRFLSWLFIVTADLGETRVRLQQECIFLICGKTIRNISESEPIMKPNMKRPFSRLKN